MNSAPSISPDCSFRMRVASSGMTSKVETVQIGQRLAVLARAPSNARCAPASSSGRDPRLSSTKGPEPIGCSAEALAFSSSVAPGRGLECLLWQDRGVEDGERGEDRRVGVLQLQDRPSSVALGRRRRRSRPRGSSRCRSSDRARASSDHFTSSGRDRRAVGELDAVAHLQRHGHAVVGHLPLGGEAGLARPCRHRSAGSACRRGWSGSRCRHWRRCSTGSRNRLSA